MVTWKVEDMTPKQRSSFGIPSLLQNKEGWEYCLTIPEVPPSQNVYNNWHWAKRSKESKRWEAMIISNSELWVNTHKKLLTKIKIIFSFTDNRRRDKDNYASFKGLMDGLVKSGVIEDDSALVVATEHEIKFREPKRQTQILGR